MATVKLQLWPGEVVMASSNSPQVVYRAGTNFSREALAFDGTVDETCYFQFDAESYGSGNLTLRIRWTVPTGTTSGDVKFSAALAAITPDTDSTDIETKAFATATTVVDSHLGTTARRVMTTTITVSNLDSLAAADHCVLKFARLGSDVLDTINAVDVLVESLLLSYSDT